MDKINEIDGLSVLEQIKVYFDYVINAEEGIVALDPTGVYVITTEDRLDTTRDMISALGLQENECVLIVVTDRCENHGFEIFTTQESLEAVVRKLTSKRYKGILNDSTMEEIADCWGLTLEQIQVERRENLSWVSENWEDSKIASELKKFSELHDNCLSEEVIKKIVEFGEPAVTYAPLRWQAEVQAIVQLGYDRGSGYTVENEKAARKQEVAAIIGICVAGAATWLGVTWWITTLWLLMVWSSIAKLDHKLSKNSKTGMQLAWVLMMALNIASPVAAVINFALSILTRIAR